MKESITRSQPQASRTNDHKHYESKCTGCGANALAKAGTACASCGAPMRAGDEYTRKTFQGDDNDLKKGF